MAFIDNEGVVKAGDWSEYYKYLPDVGTNALEYHAMVEIYPEDKEYRGLLDVYGPEDEEGYINYPIDNVFAIHFDSMNYMARVFLHRCWLCEKRDTALENDSLGLCDKCREELRNGGVREVDEWGESILF